MAEQTEDLALADGKAYAVVGPGSVPVDLYEIFDCQQHRVPLCALFAATLTQARSFETPGAFVNRSGLRPLAARLFDGQANLVAMVGDLQDRACSAALDRLDDAIAVVRREAGHLVYCEPRCSERDQDVHYRVSVLGDEDTELPTRQRFLCWSGAALVLGCRAAAQARLVLQRGDYRRGLLSGEPAFGHQSKHGFELV
jgi:hypothetical protein